MAKNFIRKTGKDRAFDFGIYFLVTLMVIITLYPFLYLISVSISGATPVQNGEIVLLPQGELNIAAYNIFFRDTSIWRAYLNSVIYALVGTVFGLLVNSMAGYALSLDLFRWKKQFTVFFMITMFFGGGLIPSYILQSKLHMVNTIWPLVLPGAMSVWYMLIFRAFFMNDISPSLRESAVLDGATELQVFLKIVLPLSKAVFATIAMYYIVGQWNSYFTPMIYLNDSEKYPLQILLQHKLTISNAQKMDGNMVFSEYNKVPVESQRAAAILASALPILMIYPFIQKYFVKGVMIGAVKG